MPVKVLLKDIVDALEATMDEFLSFVNVETGEVETVSRDLMSAAEESDEEPDLPAWQEKEWEIANRIVEGAEYIRLPTKFDIHEWSIMEDFSHSVTSDRVRNQLLDAIHGRGAFRVFKDTLRRLKIEKDWYAFREEALREIAIEWCEKHGVEWR